jgi:hypothetical protein
MRQNVFANYAAFIRVSREISHLQGRVGELRELVAVPTEAVKALTADGHARTGSGGGSAGDGRGRGGGSLGSLNGQAPRHARDERAVSSSTAGASGGGGGRDDVDGRNGGGGLRDTDVRLAAAIQDDIEALLSEQELFAALDAIRRGERLSTSLSAAHDAAAITAATTAATHAREKTEQREQNVGGAPRTREANEHPLALALALAAEKKPGGHHARTASLSSRGERKWQQQPPPPPPPSVSSSSLPFPGRNKTTTNVETHARATTGNPPPPALPAPAPAPGPPIVRSLKRTLVDARRRVVDALLDTLADVHEDAGRRVASARALHTLGMSSQAQCAQLAAYSSTAVGSRVQGLGFRVQGLGFRV